MLGQLPNSSENGSTSTMLLTSRSYTKYFQGFDEILCAETGTGRVSSFKGVAAMLRDKTVLVVSLFKRTRIRTGCVFHLYDLPNTCRRLGRVSMSSKTHSRRRPKSVA